MSMISLKKEGLEQVFTVTRTLVYYSYNYKTFDNDIMLLKVSTSNYNNQTVGKFKPRNADSHSSEITSHVCINAKQKAPLEIRTPGHNLLFSLFNENYALAFIEDFL